MDSAVITPRGKIRALVRIVARVARVRSGDIFGPSRKTEFVYARHVALMVVSERVGITGLCALGRVFDKDHSTIRAALRRTRAEIAEGRGHRADLYADVQKAIAEHGDGVVRPTLHRERVHTWSL